MVRRKESVIDTLAVLPWPLGVVFSIVGFVLVRFGLPAVLRDNQFAAVLEPATNLMSWLVLVVGLFAAAMSWIRQRQRRRLLDAQQGLESIGALGWHHFEQLVGEAFRRQGYIVEETGLGGADGGIDLILRKDRQRVLVQCKQWRRRKIPVNVVREMYGLLKHHDADTVIIACIGTFTRDAAIFAEGKPIELIDGEKLIQMIRVVQEIREGTMHPASMVEPDSPTSSRTATPDCPRCGKTMMERSNRRTGQTFWGCSAFPSCRGVL